MEAVDILPEVELDPEFTLIHPLAAEQDIQVKEIERANANDDDNVQLTDWMKCALVFCRSLTACGAYLSALTSTLSPSRVVQGFKLDIRFEHLSPK